MNFKIKESKKPQISKNRKVRASSLHLIMTKAKGKSNLEKYEEKKAQVEKWSEEYSLKHEGKTTKTALTLLDRIKKGQEALQELEKVKDLPLLSAGAISFLEDEIKSLGYNRRKYIHTNAMTKGTEVEVDSICMLNRVLDDEEGTINRDYSKTHYKRGERMENDYMTGHEDIDDKERKMTIDIKSSFTMDSFPILKDKLEKAYYRQAQAYMKLKGDEYQNHVVVKCLVNSPSHIIENELFRLKANLEKKYNGDYQLVQMEYNREAPKLIRGHLFDQSMTIVNDGEPYTLPDEDCVPEENRVRTHNVERNEKDINEIDKEVIKCRKRMQFYGY